MRSMVEGASPSKQIAMSLRGAHCDERSDEAIDRFPPDERWICFVTLAMTPPPPRFAMADVSRRRY